MRRTTLLVVFILVAMVGARSPAQQKPIHSPRNPIPSSRKSSSPQPLSLQCLKSGMLAKVAQDHLVQSIERHAYESDWHAFETEERQYQEDADKANAVFKAEVTTAGDSAAYRCYLSYQNETIETTLDRAKARLLALASYSKIGDWWSPHQSSLYKYQFALDQIFSAKLYSGECDSKTRS
jgi:hypothetical protein